MNASTQAYMNIFVLTISRLYSKQNQLLIVEIAKGLNTNNLTNGISFEYLHIK